MEKKESCGIMAIDLKSFYASCECVERGLDSMDAYLVVADGGRTESKIISGNREGKRDQLSKKGRDSGKEIGRLLLFGFGFIGLLFSCSFLHYRTAENGSLHGV